MWKDKNLTMGLVRVVQGWQAGFNLFTRILTGFAFIMGFTLIMALITLMQVQTLSASFDQLDKVRTRANLTEEIRLAITGQVAQTLDQLWSGRVTTQSGELSAKIQTNFKQLRNLETDSVSTVKLNQLEAQVTELSKLLSQVVVLDTKGQAFEARATWVKGSVLFQDFNQGLIDFRQIQETSLQATTRQAAETRNNAVLVIVICTVLGLLAAIGLALLITNSIVKRVKLVSVAMQQIAEDSNLETIDLTISGRDELAAMAQSFNQMVTKLRSALGALQTTGQTVSTSSQYFSEMMQRQLTGAEQEVNAVSSIVSAATQLKETAYQIDARVDQMSSQARDNLTNINLLSEAVLTSSSQVNKTHNATRTVTDGIQRMLNETTLVNEEVQELVKQLSSIQRLGDGLKSIATETHLLSLNAAIESASAGPYGERFRVVAAAVKSLADQSQKLVANMGFFVNQIENKVQNVTQAIAQTDAELAQSKQLVELIELIGDENTELANDMSEAIQKIGHLVEETVSQTQGIAQATREQRMATEEIISTINTVEVVIKDNMEHHHTSVAAVTDLQGEVKRLNSLVSNLNAANAGASASRPSNIQSLTAVA